MKKLLTTLLATSALLSSGAMAKDGFMVTASGGYGWSNMTGNGTINPDTAGGTATDPYSFKANTSDLQLFALGVGYTYALNDTFVLGVTLSGLYNGLEPKVGYRKNAAGDEYVSEFIAGTAADPTRYLQASVSSQISGILAVQFGMMFGNWQVYANVGGVYTPMKVTFTDVPVYNDTTVAVRTLSKTTGLFGLSTGLGVSYQANACTSFFVEGGYVFYSGAKAPLLKSVSSTGLVDYAVVTGTVRAPLTSVMAGVKFVF